MRNAILLSAAVTLTAILFSGCNNVCRYPVEPSQSEVDQVIQIAKERFVYDELIQDHQVKPDTPWPEMYQTYMRRASGGESTMTLSVADVATSPREIMVVLRETWTQSSPDEEVVDRFDTILYFHRFRERWRYVKTEELGVVRVSTTHR